MLVLRQVLVTVVAGSAWAVAGLDLLRMLPPGPRFSATAVGVGVCATVRLMLWSHEKPWTEAYELGMQLGRREAMREMNARPVSALRPASRGLADFSRAARRREVTSRSAGAPMLPR